MRLAGFSLARTATPRFASLAIVAVMLAGHTSAIHVAAALTVKVTDGGNYAGAASMVTLTGIFGTAHVNWSCSTAGSMPASQISGTITNGMHTGESPVKIGSVSGWAFHNCDGPTGPFATFKVKSLPYNIAADSTTNSSGETDLIIRGIDFLIVWSGCEFTLTGSASGYYDNTKHALMMTPRLPVKPLNKAQLTVKNVNGCAGLPSNGDHFTIESAYPLSIPVKIRST